jgi:hypothetical protein
MSVTTAYNSILSSVEFDKLTPPEQEAFLLDLNSTIFRSAVVRTVELMDDATTNAWYDLLAHGATEEKMQQFLSRNVPEAELALAETVETLADDILAVTK